MNPFTALGKALTATTNAVVKTAVVAEKAVTLVETEVDSLAASQQYRMKKVASKREQKMQKWQAKQALKES